MRSGKRLRIKRQREAWSRKAGWEAELPGSRSVSRQSIQPVYEVAGYLIRANLRVVHAVAAANRRPRIAPRVPAEADARCEVLCRVGQSLPVVAQSEIERQVAADMDAILHESGVQPLRQLVGADPEIDGLRVVLHVSQCQLIKRQSGSVLEGKCSENRESGLIAGAT